jgi:hypothetical protein
MPADEILSIHLSALRTGDFQTMAAMAILVVSSLLAIQGVISSRVSADEEFAKDPIVLGIVLAMLLVCASVLWSTSLFQASFDPSGASLRVAVASPFEHRAALERIATTATVASEASGSGRRVALEALAEAERWGKWISAMICTMGVLGLVVLSGFGRGTGDRPEIKGSDTFTKSDMVGITAGFAATMLCAFLGWRACVDASWYLSLLGAYFA